MKIVITLEKSGIQFTDRGYRAASVDAIRDAIERAVATDNDLSKFKEPPLRLISIDGFPS